MSIYKTTYSVDQLLLDGDLWGLLEKCDEVSKHIHESVPDEILLTSAGEPNIRNRYGAMLFHVSMLRITLRGFLTETEEESR